MAQVTFSICDEVVSLLGEGARNISRQRTTWVREVTCSRMWVRFSRKGAPLSFWRVLGSEYRRNSMKTREPTRWQISVTWRNYRQSDCSIREGKVRSEDTNLEAGVW